MNRNLNRLNPKMLRLPLVLLSEIFKSLHLVDLYSILLTNKKLSLLANNEYFWQIKSKFDYQEIPKTGGWLDFYKLRSKIRLPSRTPGDDEYPINEDKCEDRELDSISLFDGLCVKSYIKEEWYYHGQYMGRVLFEIYNMEKVGIYVNYRDFSDHIDTYFCQWLHNPACRHIFKFSHGIHTSDYPPMSKTYYFNKRKDLDFFISKISALSRLTLDHPLNLVARVDRWYCTLQTISDENAIYPNLPYKALLNLWSKNLSDAIFITADPLIQDLQTLYNIL